MCDSATIFGLIIPNHTTQDGQQFILDRALHLETGLALNIILLRPQITFMPSMLCLEQR